MVKKSIVLILLTCLSMLFLSGCWGSKEPDEMGYILSMGMDKGEESILDVSFQVAIPKALGSGGEGEGTNVVSLEAASIFGAIQLGNAFTARELTLIHNRVIIISEELAKEGLKKYLNPLIRSREARRNTFILITSGTAKEFLNKNKPVLEKYPSRQFELLLASAQMAGFSINSTLGEITEDVKSPGREAVAALVGVNEGHKAEELARTNTEKALYEVSYLPGYVPQEGGNKIDVIGLAAFRGDKLVGYLNGSETRYYQMVTGRLKETIFTFPDPEKPDEYIIVIEIRKGRNPEFKVDLTGEKPRFEVKLILEGEIMSIQSGINYELSKDAEKLDTYLEKIIKQEVEKVIQKTQEDFRSDIFGFGEYTRQYFWTWQDWEDYHWLEKYPDAEIEVGVQLDIRRTGLMLRTEEIHTYYGGGE